MSAGTVDVAYLMKIIYPDGFDSKMMVRGKPLLTATKHVKTFTSSAGLAIPTQIANPQGAGPTAAAAYANDAPSVGKQFLVAQKHYYQYVGIDGEVVRNGMEGSDESQFVDVFQQEMDSGMENIGSELARQAYGSSTGSRARVHPTTAPSTTTLTLSNPLDAVFFEIGMKVVAAATDGGALRGGVSYVTVVGVNVSAGTLTGDQNWSAITSIGVGDYLFRYGDQTGSVTTIADGLAGWNPLTAPTATAFCGIDRSVYPERLAGCRYAGTGDPMETVFINAMVQGRAQVGSLFKQGTIYVNPTDFARLEAAKEGGRWITDANNSYNIGIDKYRLGTMDFVQDPYCPVGIARMIGDGAFVRGSCGNQPGFNNADSLEMVLNRQTGKYESSLVHDGNYYSPRVANLMVISLPTS
jgi:hypothetical protein